MFRLGSHLPRRRLVLPRAWRWGFSFAISTTTLRPSTSELRGKASIAIIKATALEILSEPLTLLVLLAALVLTVVAPVFHYHQFGEATRMARDSGLSSLFTCGGVIAVFSTIRAFRREVESGTLEMALARPVSRGGFFFAKALGCALALLVFFLTVFMTSVTIVNGAAIGGAIAERTGTMVSVWGPAVAAGVAVILLPLFIAAALNRFANRRFVLSSTLSSALLALIAALGFSLYASFEWLLRLAPVAMLILVFSLVLMTAAAAFAIRFAANAAASFTGLVLAAFLPFVGNYYLADALAKGGTLAWSYVAIAALSALPAMLAFLILGGLNVRRYDH